MMFAKRPAQRFITAITTRNKTSTANRSQRTIQSFSIGAKAYTIGEGI